MLYLLFPFWILFRLLLINVLLLLFWGLFKSPGCILLSFFSFLSFYFLAMLCGLQDLSSLIRDQTCDLSSESVES